MVISVRLNKKVESTLRKEAIKEKKNISDIVNYALKKYQEEFKYFENIHAHHLDPVVVKAFIELADTPKKIQHVANAGAIMTEKFILFQNITNNSLQTQLDVITKFLEIHSIKISQRKETGKIIFTGVHGFGIVFSQIISSGISKVLQQDIKNIQIECNEGMFILKISEKQINF